MWNEFKKSLSCEGDVSNMRILTTICVFIAIFIAITTLSIWVYAFFSGREIKELGLMLGLVGTFLGTMGVKALQSIPENKYTEKAPKSNMEPSGD
jgi:uncharacterized membrane protein